MGVSPSVANATAAGRVTAHCDTSGRPDSTRTTRTSRLESSLGRLVRAPPPNRGIDELGLDPVDKGTVFGMTTNGSKHHGTRHRTRALVSSFGRRIAARQGAGTKTYLDVSIASRFELLGPWQR